MRHNGLAIAVGAGLLMFGATQAWANMPYPGYLCDGKLEGDACSYGSSHGTCQIDSSPPSTCTGNDKTGELCIWCEFDPNSEEAGCSVAGGASVSGGLALFVLALVARTRRRRRT